MSHAREFCEMLARLSAQNQPSIMTPNQFLLEHASLWRVRLPSRTRGVPKACFQNAYSLASRRKTLTYVEGYATGVIPVEHAWCIDGQGRVIDTTWNEDYEPDYFGVALDWALLRRLRRITGSSSVIFAWWAWRAGISKPCGWATVGSCGSTRTASGWISPIIPARICWRIIPPGLPDGITSSATS